MGVSRVYAGSSRNRCETRKRGEKGEKGGGRGARMAESDGIAKASVGQILLKHK